LDAEIRGRTLIEFFFRGDWTLKYAEGR